MNYDKKCMATIIERAYDAMSAMEEMEQAIFDIDLDSREPYAQITAMRSMKGQLRGIRAYWMRLREAMEKHPLPKNQVNK